MSTTNRLFNDVVFDNRNKSYGAYQLRLKYVDRLARAVFTTIGISCSIATLAIFFKETGSSDLVKSIEGQDEKTIEVLIPQSDRTEPQSPAVKTDHKPLATVTHTEAAPQVKNDVLDIKPTETSETKLGMNGTDGPENPSENGGGVANASSSTVPGIMSNDTDSVVKDPGVYPEFPGGPTALSRFMASHLVYPQQAIENRTAGIVYVSFIIDKAGKVSEIKPIRELPYGCTEAAIKAIGQMPDWKPGKNNGVPVKVKYTIPVKFSLR